MTGLLGGPQKGVRAADPPEARNEEKVKDIMINGEVAFAAKQFEKERKYWINQLSQNAGRVDFPFDYPGNYGNKEKGEDTVEIRFPGELNGQLLKISNRSDMRLHIILVTGLVILINKYTGSRDIIVATPIDRQETEGVFINTVLALRNRVGKSMTFKDLLMQVKQTMDEARENMNYPLESIVFESGLAEAAGEKVFPLTGTAVLLENIHEKSYLKQLPLVMTWVFSRKDGQVQGSVEYETGYYGGASIERMIGRYQMVLRQCVDDVSIPLAGIDVLMEEERRQLLRDFNNTGSPYPRDKTVIELFEDQAARTPGKKAVGCERQWLTYSELRQREEHLAGILKEKAVAGQVAALMGERDPGIIIGILGILKAGCIYLPIDGHNPGERIKFILRDSGAGVLISQQPVIRGKAGCLEDFPPGKIMALDQIFGDGNQPAVNPGAPGLPRGVGPRDIAYVIYTSGTTGKPRGVAVQHRALVNYTWWAAGVYVRGQAVDFALYTSIGFDLTLTSIFTPLITGNAVKVYTGWEKEVLVERVVDENQVGVIKITPSHLKLLRDKKIHSSDCCIKRFVVGGEELETGLARAIHDNFQGNVEIYNEYGPTEATVGCMIHLYNPREDTGRTVPVGMPAGNMQIYLLDGDGNPVPGGGIGEIYISGESLALGYIDRPELTNEKFLRGVQGGSFFKKRPPGRRRHPTAWGPYKRIYRTGDLARWLPDGRIEFLGRGDDQVKIRGFRIELGEIEHRLQEHEAVKEAVAVTKKDESGDHYLSAYVVCTREVSGGELREYLLKSLPDYMVPSFIMQVDAIPLTANGKVNKRALPEPGKETGAAYVPPGSDIEKKLAQIWSEVLKIDKERIGIDMNFFEQGGHSLSATLMLAKIRKEFNVSLVLVEIFKNPTIRELSGKLNVPGEEKFLSIDPWEEKEYYRLSSAQKRLYILQQVDLESTAFNVTRFMEVEGRLDREKFGRTCRHILDRHEGFRTSFLMIGDEAVQRVHKGIVLPVTEEGADEGGGREIVSRFTRPFDLARPPLLRVGLVKIEPTRHILMVEMHHIISDGISMALLVKEFMALYGGTELPPLRLRYRDFCQWQDSEAEKQRLKKQEEYWMNKLKGDIPTLDLPTDYPRPAVKSLEGKSIDFEIGKKETGGLKRIALEQESTLFMVLLAVYSVFLSKISGREEILVGAPAAGRGHTDLANIIGDFINTVVLKSFPAGHKSFREFLKEVREETLSATMNQDYPFDNLVEKIGRRRDASRSPLFDVVLNLLYDEAKFGEEMQTGFSGIKIKEYAYELNVSIHDLTLYPLDTGETILMAMEYCTKLFEEKTVESFTKYFREIVAAVVDNRDIRLQDIKLLEGLAYSESAISREELDDFGF